MLFFHMLNYVVIFLEEQQFILTYTIYEFGKHANYTEPFGTLHFEGRAFLSDTWHFLCHQ